MRCSGWGHPQSGAGGVRTETKRSLSVSVAANCRGRRSRAHLVGPERSASANTLIDTFAPGDERSRADDSGSWLPMSGLARSTATTGEHRPPQLVVRIGGLQDIRSGHHQGSHLVTLTAIANGALGGCCGW
ncbi:MAG: hypothetical protein QOI39_4321 [Mycobacterium sp.]|jgi:hypothetical protein|nr:hypothetical protein [Mycobacterium sp.]